MEQKITLKRVFGDVFFTAERMPENAFIFCQWFGVQSVETVMEGGNKLLEMLKEKPCSKMLNSNKAVVGSWDLALDWVEKEWTPQIRQAGLKYIAQVVPVGFYTAQTIATLIHRIEGNFEIRTFDDEELAEKWLRSLKG